MKPSNSLSRGGNRYPFPQRLFDLLQDIDVKKPELSHIISWHPNGKYFQVHNRKAFEKVIQKKHFNQTKYASFRRQLNLWGFERIPDQTATEEQDSSSLLYGGCFFHPLFQRHDRRLCCKMARVVGRDGRKSRSVSQINISLTSTSCSGDGGVSTTASSIPSIKKNDESHENQQKNASFPSDDMGSFTPTMSSFMIDDLFGPLEPIPVHDFVSFEQKSIGATSVTPSQEELNHEAVGRRGNNLSPEERSIVSAEDKEFQLLINFLSENDEHIYKYLLG